MDNTKDDKYYIQRIKKDLEFIVVHMQNVDIEELNKKRAAKNEPLLQNCRNTEPSSCQGRWYVYRQC